MNQNPSGQGFLVVHWDRTEGQTTLDPRAQGRDVFQHAIRFRLESVN